MRSWRLSWLQAAIFFLVTGYLFAGSSVATVIIFTETVENLTKRSDVIAHVVVKSIKRFDAVDGPCGIKYHAEILEPLKGKHSRSIEFFSGFGIEDVEMGIDTIVFLTDRVSGGEQRTDFSGLFDFTGDRKIHSSRCLALAPKLVLSEAMPYTIARSDLSGKSAFSNYEDDNRLKWYDENLMLLLSDHLWAQDIDGLREIEVKNVVVNGLETNLDDPTARYLLPQQITRIVTLAPAEEIKKRIKSAVDAE